MTMESETVEYTCPCCGTTGEVPHSAKWKQIHCSDCATTILNEDIDVFNS